MFKKATMSITKKVDILIAIDLLIEDYENLYNTAILVGSDTNLTQLLKKFTR